MNFISSQLNRKILFLQADNQLSDLKVIYQAKFEFYIMYVMSYLWSKNWEKIDNDAREDIAKTIMKPSIGTLVSISRKLDIEKEFFGNKKMKIINQLIDKYPSFRNEKIGHGFSFDDDKVEYLTFFESFFSLVEKDDVHEIFSDVDLVKVSKLEGDVYKGISYKHDGATYLPWACPKAAQEFSVGGLYIFDKNSGYFKISPFILIESESEFYSFISVEEKLTGRTKYNRLLKTGNMSTPVEEFEILSVGGDKNKRKYANGTIINTFENNYRKYIDIGLIDSIGNFLKKNRSSVFATIWGHGGVGKTASIQRMCEILCNHENKVFDYIVFLSAKDRLYNFYQGKVDIINGGILSLDDIVLSLNNIMFDSSSLDASSIIGYEGKLLIIIDDFETFSKVEKGKVVDFIKRLDINHHKVVLTTRAAVLVTGEEIQTKELNEEESSVFLYQAIMNEIPSFNSNLLSKELSEARIKKEVFSITSGRPLFILQLGIYVAQKGSISTALDVEISSTKAAINFLYDRLYDYLSNEGKNMFLAISLLVDENDLSGLLQNLKFILSKEDKEDEFQGALNELVKLKIIVLENRDFFKVYSSDIFKLMKIYYQKKGVEFDGSINSRFKMIVNDKNAPTEIALLDNADASRALETETEVENKYRYILNRDKTSLNIKRTAILNFASYLISNKNKIDKALKIYKDYHQLFQQDAVFIESYAVCAWASSEYKNKYKSIKILQEFLSSKPTISFATRLEMLGMLITYKAVMIISEREELKVKYRLSEVSHAEYHKAYGEQKVKINEIFNLSGNRLYTLVKDIDLSTLSPSCRNWVLDGLTHFVEVAIRCNRRHIAKAVCSKVIDELPQDYQQPFRAKLNKIDNIENGTSGGYNVKTTESNDMEIKLKQALANKSKKS